ncbi:MAG: lipoprotein [Anaerolineae bacterium]
MKRSIFYAFLIALLSACNLMLDETQAPASRPLILIPSVTPALTQTDLVRDLPDDAYDALPVSMGICFESAWDATGRVFVIRDTQAHIDFYDQADGSGLCRQPVRREPFNFDTGDVLVGRWDRGIGCTAQHEIVRYERDERSQTIAIDARFITEGTCAYELVRGMWLGITDAQTYSITLTMVD